MPNNDSNGYQPVIPGMSETAITQATANVSGGGWNQFQQTQQPNASGFNFQAQPTNNPGFFGKGGAAQMGIGAIGTLGQLWGAFQQNKIAKKSLALQERTFETNLSNQTKTYNTELEDRIATRYAAEGRDQSEVDSYVEKNRL